VTVDLRVARRFGAHRGFVDLLDLFDRRATAVGYVLTDLSGVARPLHFPAPGRSVRFGVDLSF
jgi:hypothetical protein